MNIIRWLRELFSGSSDQTISDDEVPDPYRFDDAVLSYGEQSYFEASHCLPVTWLALFDADDWLVETRTMELEDYSAALFQTTQQQAIVRLQGNISRAKAHPEVWSYLRPMAILEDELLRFEPETIIELEVSSTFQSGQPVAAVFRDGVTSFKTFINDLSDNREHNMRMLTDLLNKYVSGNDANPSDLHPVDRMFMLIGTYRGDSDREALYSLDYFDDVYWDMKP